MNIWKQWTLINDYRKAVIFHFTHNVYIYIYIYDIRLKKMLLINFSCLRQQNIRIC